MKSQSNGRNVILFSITLILVATFVIVANKISPFLIDNDNIYFKTMASGEMTGSPEPHMYYIRMIFGLIVTGLYKLTGNGIPWFGLLLVGLMATVLLTVTYSLVKECRKLYSVIIMYAVCVIVMISFFYRYFVDTQFTVVSGMVGACAVFLLALTDVSKSVKENAAKIAGFGIFSLLSYSIRSNGFLMLFPFIGVVFFIKLLDICVPLYKEKRLFSAFKPYKTLAVTLFVFLISFGLNLSVDGIGYRSSEWQDFKRYTDYSTVIVDYNGWPDYEANEALYNDNGITKSSYNAASQHYNLLLDPSINADSFKALALASEAIKEEGSSPLVTRLCDTLTTIVKRNLTDYTDRPLNLLVFWLYFSVIIMSIISKKYRVLRDILFIIVARMFDWVYLVYNGRYPFRVTQIIYFAELFALLAFIINYRLWELPSRKDGRSRFPILAAVVLAGIVGISARFGLVVMKGVKETSHGFDVLSSSFVELEQYLEAHPDNFYYFDMSNLHYRERTLDTRERPYENYIYMGGWLTSSPWYNHKLEEKGIKNPAQSLIEREDILIIYQVTDGYSRDFLQDFFDDHYPGAVVDKEDELSTAFGITYEFLSVHR